MSHASFDFEAISAVSSLDHLINLRELVGEVQVAVCPPLRPIEARKAWKERLPNCELHSDSMGLVKAVRLGLLSTLSSRRRRDVLDLRECLSLGDISVMIHIDGPTNLADIGTKCLARTGKALAALEDLIHRGRYHPKVSKDHDRTFVNTVLEEPWPVLQFY